MILTCPQCQTKFALAAEKLMPDGKTVRCSSCTHTWFQLPSFDEDDPMELPKTEAVPTEALDDLAGADDVTDMDDAPAEAADSHGFVGFATASVIIFALLIGLSLLLREPITKALPSASGYYSLFGFKLGNPVDSLSFNKVNAKIEDGVFMLAGEVINLSGDVVDVPYLVAKQFDADNHVLAEWMIKLPFDSIEGYGAQDFYSEYEAVKGAVNARVKFTLQAPVAEDKMPIKKKEALTDPKAKMGSDPGLKDPHTPPAH